MRALSSYPPVARVVLPALGCLVLASAVAAPAGAAGFSSWSVSSERFFQGTEDASATTTANGRVWQVSFDRQTRPVLRWRRIADGRGAAVPIRVPRPRGSTLQSDGGGGADAQLLIAGTRGFLSGDWCTAQDDDGDCETSRGFFVQFDIRTGRTLRSTQPRESPLLVAGTRVSYVVAPERGPILLRDAITRRLVRRLPAGALEVQGAGPFIAWKDPDDYERRFGQSGPGGDVGPDWDAIHVRVRTTGRRVYDLRHDTLRSVIQRRSSAQDAELQADGSLYLSMDLDGEQPFYPAVVDRTGRVRRVAERPMRRPNQFWSEVQGDRVLLAVLTNGNGTCGPETGWLTDIGGHRGNTFGGLPHSPGYRLSQSPDFLTPTTLDWIETRPDDDTSGRYRVRIGRDFRTLPLTTKDRPRC